MPIKPGRRDVTISARFTAEEIEQVRTAADEAGKKVTAYIRNAALPAAAPTCFGGLTTAAGMTAGREWITASQA